MCLGDDQQLEALLIKHEGHGLDPTNPCETRFAQVCNPRGNGR